jgi:hypothetical protein
MFDWNRSHILTENQFPFVNQTSAIKQCALIIAATGYTRGQSENFSQAYVKLGRSGRWVGTWTGAAVTVTLRKAFLVATHGYERQHTRMLPPMSMEP